MEEKGIEIKRVRNLVSGSTFKDKGCKIKSYRVMVLCFIKIIGKSG